MTVYVLLIKQNNNYYTEMVKGVDNMWNVISNIASVVTCVAFILYLIGHFGLQ